MLPPQRSIEIAEMISSRRPLVHLLHPNGTPQGGKLSVSQGDQREALTHQAAAREENSTISVWDSDNYVQLEEDVYALFLNNIRGADGPVTEVRTVSFSAPGSLSAPLQHYQFDDVRQATVFLDEKTATWFMYCRSSEQYGVKVAPADGQTLSCPIPLVPTMPPLVTPS